MTPFPGMVEAALSDLNRQRVAELEARLSRFLASHPDAVDVALVERDGEHSHLDFDLVGYELERIMIFTVTDPTTQRSVISTTYWIAYHLGAPS